MSVFTFLHISDLHRSAADPISNADLLSALIADCDRYQRESPSIPVPDVIMVSGDLVQGVGLDQSGREAELDRHYSEAAEFLQMLTEELHGDRSPVVLIPGNHDVDWNTARSAMSEVKIVGNDVKALLDFRANQYRWSWKLRKLFRNYDTCLRPVIREICRALLQISILARPMRFQWTRGRPGICSFSMVVGSRSGRLIPVLRMIATRSTGPSQLRRFPSATLP